MSPRHIDDLFSLALDGGLSDAQRQRFDAHMRECAQCRSGYEEVQAAVDAVRALPAARMPRVVHLPSTPPVAEQRTRPTLGWPAFLRYRAGMASGVAVAAAAAILVVAVTHQGTSSGTRPNAPLSAAQRNNAASTASGGASTPSCPQPAGSTAAPPAQFNHRSLATDAARPGQQLVLATTSGEVGAGTRVPVYAVLTAPLPAAGEAPALRSATAIEAIPCVTVARPLSIAYAGNVGADQFQVPAAAPQATGTYKGSAVPQPVFYITVPPGTPSHTTLQITATVPAGYPNAGDPALSVELTITVR
jgi:Putative zinc-finger